MLKEELNRQLFDKIPKNAKVAIFGAGGIGGSMAKDIYIRRPDAKVVCFIDNKKTGQFWNLPVYGLKEFIDKKIDVDIVIISSYSAQFSKVNMANVNNILDIYNIPYIPMSKFLLNKYEGNLLILNDETYSKVINILETEEDRELFNLIFRVHTELDTSSVLSNYYKKAFPEIWPVSNTIRHHYLDKINKEKIKIVFDVGFNTGFNALAYKKLLPNYSKSYAFEAIYETCRDKIIDEFIMDDTIKIVKAAVGEYKGKAKFYINNSEKGGSFIDFSHDTSWQYLPKGLSEVEVNVITLDDFCKENNVYPDFIKMDIEGAELFALKGGIEAINKSRAQLAISIYHSPDDLVNIPIYLSEHLDNYVFKLGHYCPAIIETILYAIPKELVCKS